MNFTKINLLFQFADYIFSAVAEACEEVAKKAAKAATGAHELLLLGQNCGMLQRQFWI